jgi:glycosyltransferase involved in cell wall biosynthesis
MKKVLLIGYPFPLRQGGSPRLLGLAKYLPEFGWQPIILTAPLDLKSDGTYNIIETQYRSALGFWTRLFRLNPDKDIRNQIKQRLSDTGKKSLLDRLLTLAGEIVNYPDSDKGWKPFAVKAGDEIIRNEGIDAIISTSAPITVHLIAKELKLKHKIPWIADLRDLWSQNHNYSYSPIRRWFDTRLELKTFSKADALVTVSRPWADKLSALHRGKAVYAITNGFDPDIMGTPPAEKLTKKFSITYTGLIYPKQDPVKLLKALSQLITTGMIDKNDLEIRFYGTIEPWLDNEARQSGLSAVFKQYGQVSRDIALQKQRESQVLLLLNWEDPQEKGNYPGKVFEYFSSKRPVLATGGSDGDVVDELLKETKTGIHASDIEETKKALVKMYEEYKSRGRVSYRPDVSAINRYSHREMARKFSEILGRLN